MATRRAFEEIAAQIRGELARRRLRAGDRLPAERDLAIDFGVSRITVRKGLDGLVAEGLLDRRQGSGNFVAGRVEKNFSALTSFSEDMRARGRVPTCSPRTTRDSKPSRNRSAKR